MELLNLLVTQSGLIQLIHDLIPYLIRIYNFTAILAPILSVIYIIIGGFKLTTSGGDKEKISSAKKTITAALVGCLIVLLAYPILNVIAYVLTPPNSPLHFLDWYADFITVLALVYTGYGGIQYTNSNGNPRQILEARRTIFYAIQGYIWMLMVRVVFFAFSNGKF